MTNPISPSPELDEREGSATFTEPEEALVADSRNGLTPAQLVGRKLRALLGRGASPFDQPNGRQCNEGHGGRR